MAFAQERPNLMPGEPPQTAPGSGLVPGEPVRIDRNKAPQATQTQTVPAITPDQEKSTSATPSEKERMDPSVGASPSVVYSEDWWSHTRPVLELHGYFRTRGEFFHLFTLGQANDPNTDQLWPNPFDNSYQSKSGAQRTQALCGPATQERAPDGTVRAVYGACNDRSQASANMRFRLNPELHISDNLRIMSQIDALDNLVLGSTPDSYALNTGGATNPNARNNLETTSQGAPTAGVNGTRNSIDVKRAWVEYVTPVGQLRFGRMPFHWGMGMLYNAGDQTDQDWQTNVDRIMFASGIRSMDLYFGGSWDFVSSGPTNANPYDVYGGQPYNTANRSNVGQWTLFAMRRTAPDTQRLSLARGDVVLNGGLLGMLRLQELDLPASQSPNRESPNFGFERRGATVVTGDAWAQLLWKKLRVEFEGAVTAGTVEVTPDNANPLNAASVLTAGFTAEADYRAVEDKLRVAFGTGWASGDPGQFTLNPGANAFSHGPAQISMFRFSPAYNIDLILHRRLLQRVQGTYYFRPAVDYDFIRSPNGQRFGGSAAAIYTRASEFVQTPGHKNDLGVELNLSVYYQAKDGNLNDNPGKAGGFYSMLQWGILFPLAGLDGSPSPGGVKVDTSQAQTVRLHLGVVF
jgi:uncharacterized protein (TIGR04551 family)